MRDARQFLSGSGQEVEVAFTIRPVGPRGKRAAAHPKPTWLGRLFSRPEKKPNTFQRCLAVHMHFAAPQRTLS